jgi:putative hydrolase of the HAD superfamily
MIKHIAFDADDTLWHNERIFNETKNKYTNLLAAYHSQEWIEARLDEAETRNIQHFGYGIKGFTLSMIETACELTEGRINGDEIQQIIGLGREMLSAPINLLDGVQDTIHELSNQFDLMLITKGDLFDQEAKLARSGIGNYFKTVEIVSQKNASDYQKILNRYQITPGEFVMIGNSLKSDILPVLEIGAKAIHVEYETEWAHEKVSDEELIGKDFLRLKQMSELTKCLKML